MNEDSTPLDKRQSKPRRLRTPLSHQFVRDLGQLVRTGIPPFQAARQLGAGHGFGGWLDAGRNGGTAVEKALALEVEVAKAEACSSLVAELVLAAKGEQKKYTENVVEALVGSDGKPVVAFDAKGDPFTVLKRTVREKVHFSNRHPQAAEWLLERLDPETYRQEKQQRAVEIAVVAENASVSVNQDDISPQVAAQIIAGIFGPKVAPPTFDATAEVATTRVVEAMP